jgi:hypothetical protein
MENLIDTLENVNCATGKSTITWEANTRMASSDAPKRFLLSHCPLNAGQSHNHYYRFSDGTIPRWQAITLLFGRQLTASAAAVLRRWRGCEIEVCRQWPGILECGQFPSAVNPTRPGTNVNALRLLVAQSPAGHTTHQVYGGATPEPLSLSVTFGRTIQGGSSGWS